MQILGFIYQGVRSVCRNWCKTHSFWIFGLERKFQRKCITALVSLFQHLDVAFGNCQPTPTMAWESLSMAWRSIKKYRYKKDFEDFTKVYWKVLQRYNIHVNFGNNKSPGSYEIRPCIPSKIIIKLIVEIVGEKNKKRTAKTLNKMSRII